MRILLHDYSGHPPQVALSRALADRGHEVCHAWSADISTPRGALTPHPDDPPGLELVALSTGRSLDKYGYLRRLAQERAYGRELLRLAARWRPDVIVSSNTPPLPMHRLVRWSRRRGVRHVYWVMDLYGLAARRILGQRYGLPGKLGAALLLAIERHVASMSDVVIGITDDFETPIFGRDGSSRYASIPLWGVLGETPLKPRENAWAQRHGLNDTINLVYAGTLGLKHNPSLLLELARSLQSETDARVVVCSEGQGAEWLRTHGDDLDNIVLLPFQAYEDLPEMLGTADILLAILEPDAGVYSVPSKVLTNLCAGRPQLLAIPPENLAGRIVTDADAGITVSPEDAAGFIAAAQEMIANRHRRARQGANARAWAEVHFQIGDIATMFERILEGERPDKRLSGASG